MRQAVEIRRREHPARAHPLDVPPQLLSEKMPASRATGGFCAAGLLSTHSVSDALANFRRGGYEFDRAAQTFQSPAY